MEGPRWKDDSEVRWFMSPDASLDLEEVGM